MRARKTRVHLPSDQGRMPQIPAAADAWYRAGDRGERKEGCPDKNKAIPKSRGVHRPPVKPHQPVSTQKQRKEKHHEKEQTVSYPVRRPDPVLPPVRIVDECFLYKPTG